jgi:threonine 3-dehydrogenase
MRKKAMLITGANGEIGHGLIDYLSQHSSLPIVTLDVQEMSPELAPACDRVIQGDILDNKLYERLISDYELVTIYHLASILSTRAEFNPEAAHRVNVEGTLNLLGLAAEQSQWQGRAVRFIYPSSIAAYGLPDLQTKTAAGKVVEDLYCAPQTMYGCNKLYCEHLGRYYATHYRRLAAEAGRSLVDFRCLRFPGLISAFTLPTGGTSDYGPEMLHHAAQGEPYACFVRADTRLPFMAMPDAIKALIELEQAPREQLKRFVYNVTSFSPSAQAIYDLVKRAFPEARVSFEPDELRQGIVDSWPADIDDSAARQDWGWSPEYDLPRAFGEYLIPEITRRYRP